MIKTAIKEPITIARPPGWAESYLEIPAGNSLQSLYEHSACPPLLRRSLSGPISWPQRVDMTVAQVLLSPKLAPVWIAALLVLDARIVQGSDGIDEILLSALLTGPGLQGRQLRSLRVPLDSQLRWGEAQVKRMPADRPLVAAVTAVELNGGSVRRARLGLTGVWRQQARLAEAAALLVDHPLDSERIEAVAQAVGREVAPTGDFLGSAAYRRAMAIVVTRQALDQCRQLVGDSQR